MEILRGKRLELNEAGRLMVVDAQRYLEHRRPQETLVKMLQFYLICLHSVKDSEAEIRLHFPDGRIEELNPTLLDMCDDNRDDL